MVKMQKTLSLICLLIASSLSIGVKAQRPDENPVKGVHEVLDPNAQTDDLGISVPIAISHPARRYPADNNFPTGPGVGESLPDINLRNQHGELINFQERDKSSNAVVVFFRSTSW